MAHVDMNRIGKDFSYVPIIPELSRAVEDGELCVLVGPSGCGKSTLLRMIAGLESVTRRSIRIDGHDVTHLEPSQRGVAMVFQTYALYPYMSVEEPHSSPKCNTIGGGEWFCCRMMLRIGQEAATVPLKKKRGRPPCPRATAT